MRPIRMVATGFEGQFKDAAVCGHCAGRFWPAALLDDHMMTRHAGDDQVSLTLPAPRARYRRGRTPGAKNVHRSSTYKVSIRRSR